MLTAYQLASHITHIITDYDKAMILNNNVIITGDLNLKHANWGCRVINADGKYILPNTEYLT